MELETTTTITGKKTIKRKEQLLQQAAPDNVIQFTRNTCLN